MMRTEVGLLGGLLDDIVDTLSSLAERPIRLTLLVLVFALGSGGAVVARGITESSAEQVTESITSASLDQVTFHASPATTAGGAANAVAPRFPQAGVSALKRMANVESAGLLWSLPADTTQVRRLDGSSPVGGVRVVGANASWLQQNASGVAPSVAGQLLDVPGISNVVILGAQAARDLSVTGSGEGQKIWINGESFTVVGLVTGSKGDVPLEEAVIITGGDADRLSSRLIEQVLTVRTAPNAARVVAHAAPLLLDPAHPGQFVADPIVDLDNLRRGVSSQLASTIAILSALLLFAASVTTANTMIMSVMTRTPEVALRRAMGSPRRRIARLFILEGAVVGGLGGAAGASIGIVVVVAVAAVKNWTAILSLSLVPIGVGLGAAVGVLSALYPAMRASNVDPSTAMRQ